MDTFEVLASLPPQCKALLILCTPSIFESNFIRTCCDAAFVMRNSGLCYPKPFCHSRRCQDSTPKSLLARHHSTYKWTTVCCSGLGGNHTAVVCVAGGECAAQRHAAAKCVTRALRCPGCDTTLHFAVQIRLKDRQMHRTHISK